MAVLAWRGGLVGVRVIACTPTDGEQAVSSRTAMRIAFAQPMRQEETEAYLDVDPPVEGRVSWEGNTLVFRPAYPLVPDQTYLVTLRAGAPSQRGRRVRRDVSCRFTVGHPRLLYLAADEQERLQLYVDDDPSPRQLTTAETDVWDYAIGPEGARVAYSVLREDGGSDLWQIDRDGRDTQVLLACPDAACTAPAWSADGRRMAYERKDLTETVIGLHSGPLTSHIWLLDVLTGETAPLYADAPTPGHSPAWSPVGERLAFYDQSERAVQVYDLRSGEQQFFDTLEGVGTWSPSGEQMVIPLYVLYGEHADASLMRVDVSTRAVLDLSAPEMGSDDTPHWSPSGAWIAFGRTALGDGTPTWGAQLWLMRPDGSEVRALVADPEVNFGAFAWRPDGGALAYVRLPVAEMSDPHPELWVVTLDDGQSEQVARDAILPGWLP
jgi:TolB protein